VGRATSTVPTLFFVVNLLEGDEEEGRNDFMEIKIPCNLPQYLFKFYALSEFGRSAFLGHYLYLSHPCQLNDFMDGEIYTLDMRGIVGDSKEFNRLKQEALDYSPLIKDCPCFCESSIENKMGLYELQKVINSCYFDFGGIVSLAADSRYNELLWSHYAKETGFMIEFYTETLLQEIEKHPLNYLFKDLRLGPVSYKEHPLSVDCKEKSIHDINTFNVYQKQKDWSYEKEWRILAISNALIERKKELEGLGLRGYLRYQPKAISRIYLGRRFWQNISDTEEKAGKNVRIYTVKSEYISFVKELRSCVKPIFMSGTGECAEYRFGTDVPIYDNSKGICEFQPKHYYLTRSFERITKIEISNNEVTVTFEGKYRTKDEDFVDPISDRTIAYVEQK